jgi:hypothetical protein
MFYHLSVVPWTGDQAFNTWAFTGHFLPFGDYTIEGGQRANAKTGEGVMAATEETIMLGVRWRQIPVLH